MRLVKSLVFAAGVLLLLQAQLRAASVCTGIVNLDNDEGCLDNIFNRTNIAGLDAKPDGDTYFFWMGDNVIVARCMRPGETVVALFAYHQQKDKACPMLSRVRDALQHKP
jgi:hypothetical protein